MPKELEHVSLLSIWENKIPKIQNIITQKMYENEKIDFELMINNIDIAMMGNINSQNLNFHQLKARLFKIQHISNKDRHVSAWINSNPTDLKYKMNNPAWNIAMKSRLQLDLNDNSKIWCLCGERIDHLCVHPYTCTNKNIYNAMRGSHHKKIKSVLQDLISTSNSKYKLENNREPVIEDYFPRIQQHTQENQTAHSSRINDNHENIPDKNIHRGDILLRNNTNGKALIIDLKLTDPFAKFIKDHIHATQPANQGEDIKRNQYNKFYDMKPTDTARMIFFTLTTSGAPSKDAKDLVNIIFEDESEETKSFKTQQFYERLSSAIQSIKSLNIQNTIKFYNTDQRLQNPPPYSELPSPFSQRRYLPNALEIDVATSQISQNSANQNSEIPDSRSNRASSSNNNRQHSAARSRRQSNSAEDQQPRTESNRSSSSSSTRDCGTGTRDSSVGSRRSRSNTSNSRL